MPLIFQKRIYREDLQANPHITYVFGDNELRKGLGGQAGEMRGEPNSFGIPTKKAPNNSPSSFWTDADFKEKSLLLDEKFNILSELLLSGKVVIFPMDGIGTGLSDLPNKAPKLNLHIRNWVKLIRKI